MLYATNICNTHNFYSTIFFHNTDIKKYINMITQCHQKQLYVWYVFPRDRIIDKVVIGGMRYCFIGIGWWGFNITGHCVESVRVCFVCFVELHGSLLRCAQMNIIAGIWEPDRRPNVRPPMIMITCINKRIHIINYGDKLITMSHFKIIRSFLSGQGVSKSFVTRSEW